MKSIEDQTQLHLTVSVSGYKRDMCSCCCKKIVQEKRWLSVAEWVGGGLRLRDANSQSGIILQNFCRKLHENETIWTQGGHCYRRPFTRFQVSCPFSTDFLDPLLSNLHQNVLSNSVLHCFRYPGHPALMPPVQRLRKPN